MLKNLFEKRFSAEAEDYLKSVSTPMKEIYKAFDNLPSVELGELVNENAALVIVDMINGFTKQGALASPNSLAINGTVAALAGTCEKHGIPIAALCDCHSLSSPEFESFPVHCLADSNESEITDEILAACKPERINKNSTNGYLEPEFRDWMDRVGTSTFIIVGVCSDICVLQLSLTMKTHFNAINRNSRILVPVNCTTSYSLGNHDARLVNTSAFYIMQTGGVELCSEIKY